jgi:hypothetical protein
MSRPVGPKPPGPNKWASNTGLIVGLVLLFGIALGIPALCLCGGASFLLFPKRSATQPYREPAEQENPPRNEEETHQK